MRKIFFVIILGIFLSLHVNVSANSENRQYKPIFNGWLTGGNVSSLEIRPELKVGEEEKEKSVPENIRIDLEICERCLEALSIACAAIVIYTIIVFRNKNRDVTL